MIKRSCQSRRPVRRLDRLLALVLSLAMVTSSVPASAFAEVAGGDSPQPIVATESVQEDEATPDLAGADVTGAVDSADSDATDVAGVASDPADVADPSVDTPSEEEVQPADAPAAPAKAPAADAADKAVSLNGQASYDTIAAALEAAADGDTITLNADVSENITVTKGVTLDLGGHTLTGVKDADNPVSVITVNAASATVTIQNGTITGGDAGQSGNGGGIYVTAGALAASDLTLTGNSAGNMGSAICMKSGTGNLSVDDCTITGNTSTYAAGSSAAAIDTGSRYTGDVRITNSTITGNTRSNNGKNEGGAINFSHCNSAVLEGNTIGGNDTKCVDVTVTAETSAKMSGGELSSGASLKANDVVLDGSRMILKDGAAFIVDATNTATVSNLSFKDYALPDAVATGQTAIFAALLSVEAKTGTMTDVTADNCQLGKWRAIEAVSNGTVALDGCTVANVTGALGGVLTRGSGSTAITNSRLTGNTATASGFAGALTVGQGTTTLDNTVITGNTGVDAGGVIVQTGATLNYKGTALCNNKNADGDVADVYAESGSTVSLASAANMMDGDTALTGDGYVWDCNGVAQESFSSFTDANNANAFNVIKVENRKVAAFNGEEYPTVEEALAAAKESGEENPTVQLIGDAKNVAMTTDAANGAEVPVNVTLDLNGHNLYPASGQKYALSVAGTSLKVVNTAATLGILHCGIYIDGEKGGDVTIDSTDGNIKLDENYPHGVNAGTFTLKGTIDSSMAFDVVYEKDADGAAVPKGKLVAADDFGMAGSAAAGGKTITINPVGIDDVLKKFKSSNDADSVDDLQLIQGGSDAIAPSVVVPSVAGAAKAVVQYDAATGAVVLRKLNYTRALFVNGSRGRDTNQGTAARPFKTMEKALEVYKANKDSYDTIYVAGTVTPTSSEWDGDGVTVRRLPVTLDRRAAPRYTGSLVSVPKDTSLSLKNITFDGMSSKIKGTKPMFVVDGTLTLGEGATLRNNNASTSSALTLGGAIRGNRYSTINVMCGSKVANNAATYGGGIYSAGTINMTGGEVSGNHAVTNSSFNGAGGGICLDNYDDNQLSDQTATLNLSGGQITGNTSDYFGGGIALRGLHGIGYKTDSSGKVIEKPSNKVVLNMTASDPSAASCPSTAANGATVSNNVAGDAGGGIYIAPDSVATVSSGNITNNKAKAARAQFSGGGIYVNGVNTEDYSLHDNGRLELTNVVVTDNTASRGAGLAGCPASRTKVYVTDGGAFYGNTATGTKGDLGANRINEIYTKSGSIPPHHGSPKISIAPYMLGGSEYHWTYATDTDNHKAGEEVDAGDLVNAVEVSLNNQIAEDGDEAAKANKLAKVYITGNTANSCGGGIGSDGDVIIGTPGAWLPFTGNSGLGFVEFLGVAVLAAGAVALYRNRREWDFPAPKGGDCDE